MTLIQVYSELLPPSIFANLTMEDIKQFIVPLIIKQYTCQLGASNIVVFFKIYKNDSYWQFDESLNHVCI